MMDVKTAILPAVAALAAAVGEPAMAAPQDFVPEISVFDIEDEIYPPEPCSTLFVGSSSIRFWTRLAADFPTLNIVRRGYGGSTIADTNFYFDRIVARHQPGQIVFYAGENDLHAGMSPKDVLADFESFMEKKTKALGQTPVFFVSIKPSKARFEELEAQSRTNALIAAMAADRPDLVYIDIATPMLSNGAPKNIFISDDLHMTAEGYAIWRDRIGAALQEAETSLAPACGQ